MPTALVTGASSGIGRELARSFARRGYDLVLTARSEVALLELAHEARESHRVRADVVPADLALREGPAALLNALSAGDHRIDVFVNNAGFANFGPFYRIPLEDDLDLVRVNVLAATWLAKALLPAMIERGHGGMLAVASTAAFQPGPKMAAYYASKAYLLHLCEAVAEELRGTGVTVTALCPGPTATGFQARADMLDARLVRRGRGIMVDAAEVAEAGVRAFERGQRVYVPGLLHRLGTLLPRFVPRAWSARAIGRIHVEEPEAEA